MVRQNGASAGFNGRVEHLIYTNEVQHEHIRDSSLTSECDRTAILLERFLVCIPLSFKFRYTN